MSIKEPNNAIKLIISLAIPQIVATFGAFFTSRSIETWYQALEKPALNPPNWVFMPVWTVLYVLMGIAAFLVWEEGLGKREVKLALGVFLLQLIANGLWSLFFFGLQSPLLGLLDILLLWLLIVLTIVLFYRISKVASILLVPYLVWVSFASYLNYAIWTLN